MESTLFNISRRHFENVDIFQKTYLFEEVPTVGLNDENPLRLEGIDAADFRCLLTAMIYEYVQVSYFAVTDFSSRICKG